MSSFIECFRKLRQLVDEIADVPEDIRAGRLTFPILAALSSKAHGNAVKRTVRAIWKETLPVFLGGRGDDLASIRFLDHNQEIARLVPTLIGEVDQAGGFAHAFEECEHLHTRAMASLVLAFPYPKTWRMMQLVMLKMAFAERLKRQNWIDTPVPSLSADDFS
ncbi:MAG: hypothetical protein DPW13_11905 [Planctomycetes bacterium]|nr:hypothetical protein [Planctomycetota bacterium]